MSSLVNGTDRAGAVKARTPEEVEADVARVAAGLQALKAEREAVCAGRAEAEELRDAWRLEEIDRRARELGERIDAEQARLCRLSAERARLELPEAEEKAEGLRADYDRAHAEYLAAYERTNRLGVDVDNAKVHALRLRQTIDDNERRAQELIRQIPPALRGSLTRQS